MEETNSKKRRDRRMTAAEVARQPMVYVVGGTPCPFRYPESEYNRVGKWHTPNGTLVIELVKIKPS